jgi:molybdenum cofactor guanylyltransferase
LSQLLADGDASAFVLAGGRSSRMGQDKALIQLRGIPLVLYAVDIFKSAGLTPRIAGGGSELSSFALVVPDDQERPALGPLSGICSALSQSRTRYSIFLSVDLPLIPPSLILYLAHHANVTESAVTAVSVAGFVQTFPVVIDAGAASALRASLNSNDRNCLRAFQAAAKTMTGRFSVLPIEHLLQAGLVRHPSCLPPTQWFLNINMPDDLASAESLLSGRHQVS